jgi:polar amino acid transport system substrate-binding protein
MIHEVRGMKMRFLGPFLAAALVALGACQSTPPRDQPPAEIPSSDRPASAPAVVRVATDATFSPMEYKDDSGALQGFDIDLMRAVAEAAGFKVRFVDVPWDHIFSGLDDGQYDAVASSVTITRERAAVLGFSDPYINGGQVLIVPADRKAPTQLSNFQGKLVGVQIGTTGEMVADRYPGILKRLYADITDGFGELSLGVVDGIIVDLAVAVQFTYYESQYSGRFRIVPGILHDEWFGFVVRHGDSALIRRINDGLQATMTSGTYERLFEKWFHLSPDLSP